MLSQDDSTIGDIPLVAVVPVEHSLDRSTRDKVSVILCVVCTVCVLLWSVL